MTGEPALVILFDSEDAANALVAGVPAAARAAMTISASYPNAAFAVSGGWSPTPFCMQEIKRLAPLLKWEAADADQIHAHAWINAADVQTAHPEPAPAPHLADIKAASTADLKKGSARILASTSKAGDGIVSRHINRPISQSISGIVLLWSGARPWHATLAAGLIGLAMLIALLFYGHIGLIIGAILFQTASIVDGVDGEMARATFRSSDQGAMMDSLTDAATNLGFIGGVSYNLFASGFHQAAVAGAIGCAVLALGSALLGWQSRKDGAAFTFDALKTRFRERPSRLKQWLTWITMRDFYALAACIAILIGLVQPLMFAFAIIASAWLCVLLFMLARSNLASP